MDLKKLLLLSGGAYMLIIVTFSYSNSPLTVKYLPSLSMISFTHSNATEFLISIATHLLFHFFFYVLGPIKRTPWTSNEIRAVEKHMMRLIESWKVPGKAECDRCIEAEPLALQNRDWLAVKFYVKNRITALQRKV